MIIYSYVKQDTLYATRKEKSGSLPKIGLLFRRIPSHEVVCDFNSACTGLLQALYDNPMFDEFG